MTLNAKYIHSSLALRYLKTVTTDIAECSIREYSINTPVLDILSDLFSNRPHLIGMACYIWNIEEILKLADLIKKVLPESKIVLGGPEVSYDADDVMIKAPCIDYVILGEGEVTLRKLIQCIEDSADPVEIQGLAWRNGLDIIVNGGPQVVPDLNKLPFPYYDEDINELNGKIIYYETSRGCPFACRYCLSSTTHGVRFFGTERVIDELNYLISKNVRQIKFVDRTYNINKNHFLPIMRFLASQECDTNFHFEITAELLDDDVFALLRNVPPGRFQFEIGVQSTNPQTLEHSGRKSCWSKLAEQVRRLREIDGIHLHLDLIAGLPYESFERFGISFNDVFQLKPHNLQIGFLKLLKGSEMRLRSKEYEMQAMSMPPYEVLSTHVLSYPQMRRLKILESVFEYYYNSQRFSATLQWLVDKVEQDAFFLFDRLANYWEQNKLQLVAHSHKSLYRYLFEFCRENYSEQKIFRELFKYDCLCFDRGRLKPDYLPWNDKVYNQEISSFWHDSERVCKYIPNYKFKNWRQIQSQFHIEIFSFDILQYLDDKIIIDGLTPVMFSYDSPGPQVQTLKREDFWL